MPGVSAGKDGAARTQPGFESREASPGACGSLKTKPSLAMFRNMNVYMIGTSDGRSTAPGAKEFWTVARAREVPVARFARTGVSGVVAESNMTELRYLSSELAGEESGDFFCQRAPQVDPLFKADNEPEPVR